MQSFFLQTLCRGRGGFSTETLQTIFPYKVPSVAFGPFLKDKANEKKKKDVNKSFSAKQWENRLFLLVTLPASAFTGVSDLRAVAVLKSGHCASWVMLHDLSCLSSLTSLFHAFTPPHCQTTV